ncbi:MAG: glycerol-3-phosphate 1-O-acyltransferase PlsY [Clostridiales bacterium]|nr:glycerol-3-phosphate 1-O-acyltransferase PlsY [Clostridiales bacterium]
MIDEGAIRIAAGAVTAYFIGAIPFALIIGKRYYGVDVREHGSGNLGATNVLRVLGARAALATFALDIAKGAAAVGLGILFHAAYVSPSAYDWVLLGTMLAAVLGHSYSPYVRFTGGKGVATAAGALLVVTPLAWPVLFVSFVLVVYLTRLVSLGSVIIALQFPVLVVLLYGDRPALIVLSLVTAALVVWRHRSNIGRIIRGQEDRISVGKGVATVREREGKAE